MERVRTIEQLHKELLKDDPGCCLTKTALRRMVTNGTIPSIRVGTKYLVSREAVEKYLEAVE